MKITLKSLISLCLTVLLLISTVACNSPVEPPMDNDANTGGTTGLFTESSSEAETTEAETELRGERLYEQLKKSGRIFWVSWDMQPNLFELDQIYQKGHFDYDTLYTLSAPWEEEREDLRRVWTVEVSPNVYVMWGVHEVITRADEMIQPPDENAVGVGVNYHGDATLYECSIFFSPVIDEFVATIPDRNPNTNAQVYRDEMVHAIISNPELYEQYALVFESNEIWATDPDSYYPARIDCLLTRDQILNFTLPSEDYSVIIAWQATYK